MKRWIKWTVTAIGVLFVLAALAVLLGQQLAQRKRARTIEVAVKPVAYASDAQSLERGKYLFESRGCAECHGANGAGREFVNDGKGARLAAPNITASGRTADYRPEDWERTIRHGVKPGGQPVMVMPSEDYNRFTDVDLAAVVAYARSLPARQGGAAVIEFPLPVWVLYGFGVIPRASLDPSPTGSASAANTSA